MRLPQQEVRDLSHQSRIVVNIAIQDFEAKSLVEAHSGFLSLEKSVQSMLVGDFETAVQHLRADAFVPVLLCDSKYIEY
jgi:hypothetical protein